MIKSSISYDIGIDGTILGGEELGFAIVTVVINIDWIWKMHYGVFDDDDDDIYIYINIYHYLIIKLFIYLLNSLLTN